MDKADVCLVAPVEDVGIRLRYRERGYQTFLKKLGYEKAWYAWVPIAGTYAILEAGEQEDVLMWTLISCVPCIGLISLIKLIPAYIRICERLGKPPAILWTFLLCGLGSVIVPVVLAFT